MATYITKVSWYQDLSPAICTHRWWSRNIESLMTSTIIFLMVGNRPRSLVSSLAAFPTGYFTFNKEIDFLFSRSALPFILFEGSLIAEFTFLLLIYSWNFLDTTLMFFIIPIFRNWLWRVVPSPKSCKNYPFFYFSNLCFSAATWLYSLKTLIASAAVTLASHVTLHIPWLDFLSTIYWST